MSTREGALSLRAANAKFIQEILKGNWKFTTSIYKAVSKKDGNVLISPFSVGIVLTLAYMGAKGSTADEIASALGLSSEREDTLKGISVIMKSLQDIENVTLDTANKVYSMCGYQILQEFSQIAEKSFFAGAQELNFCDGEASRKVINSWVEEKTRNKIKDMIPSGLLDSSTRIVLVNALYFKGSWQHTFFELREPELFHLNSKENKMVPMINRQEYFGYAESDELDAKIVKINYKSTADISMYFILPNEIDGISEMEDKLAKADLSKILHNLQKPEVVVTVPKFILEETIDFDPILKELGMVSMYDSGEADFSGMSGKRDLFVSTVLQKTFIEVNEEGTEAAAATAYLEAFMCERLEPDPEIFFADHPFLFVLMCKDILLFIGRMSVPN